MRRSTRTPSGGASTRRLRDLPSATRDQARIRSSQCGLLIDMQHLRRHRR
jgi:hypothetical protein